MVGNLLETTAWPVNFDSSRLSISVVSSLLQCLIFAGNTHESSFGKESEHGKAYYND